MDVYAAAWLVADCAAELAERDATVWTWWSALPRIPTVEQFVPLSARFTALQDMAERLPRRTCFGAGAVGVARAARRYRSASHSTSGASSTAPAPRRPRRAAAARAALPSPREFTRFISSTTNSPRSGSIQSEVPVKPVWPKLRGEK